MKRSKTSMPDHDDIDRECFTCEMNMGGICAGHVTRPDNGEDTYGITVDETSALFPDGCDDWEPSIEAFVNSSQIPSGKA